MRQVLATDADKAPKELGSSYAASLIDLFPWYKHLFVEGSKPVVHMRAMVALQETDWIDNAPPVLLAIVRRVHELIARVPVDAAR